MDDMNKQKEKFVEVINYKIKRTDGVSRTSLAKTFDLPKSTLNGYLSNRAPIPLSVAFQLAYYFNVDLNAFLYDSDMNTLHDDVAMKLANELKEVPEQKREELLNALLTLIQIYKK